MFNSFKDFREADEKEVYFKLEFGEDDDQFCIFHFVFLKERIFFNENLEYKIFNKKVINLFLYLS